MQVEGVLWLRAKFLSVPGPLKSLLTSGLPGCKVEVQTLGLLF